LSSKKDDESAELKRAAETATTELQQSLQQQRDKTQALERELAMARRDVEALAALSSKKDDESAELKRAAETATTELQQFLQQQRDKTQALQSQPAIARNVGAEVATSGNTNEEAAQLKQPVETVTSEVILQEAVSRKESDEALRIGQAAENAKAELRPFLNRERDKPDAPAPDAKSTRRVAAAAAAEQLVPSEARGSPEAAGLLSRAKALLGQGNIGAARVVLERAAETGSAQATFALAETYDPLVLSTWRTYGTQGDATKARELYARAYEGGIKAAKDRSDALLLGDRQPAGWLGREKAAH
jgi:hypothetical protein